MLLRRTLYFLIFVQCVNLCGIPDAKAQWVVEKMYHIDVLPDQISRKGSVAVLLDLDKTLGFEYTTVYTKKEMYASVYSGLKSALKNTKDKNSGVRFYVLTTLSDVPNKLKKLGIDHLIDGVISSRDYNSKNKDGTWVTSSRKNIIENKSDLLKEFKTLFEGVEEVFCLDDSLKILEEVGAIMGEWGKSYKPYRTVGGERAKQLALFQQKY